MKLRPSTALHKSNSDISNLERKSATERDSKKFAESCFNSHDAQDATTHLCISECTIYRSGTNRRSRARDNHECLPTLSEHRRESVRIAVPQEALGYRNPSHNHGATRSVTDHSRRDVTKRRGLEVSFSERRPVPRCESSKRYTGLEDE